MKVTSLLICCGISLSLAMVANIERQTIFGKNYLTAYTAQSVYYVAGSDSTFSAIVRKFRVNFFKCGSVDRFRSFCQGYVSDHSGHFNQV